MSDPEREYIPTKRVLWTCECGNEVEALDDPFVKCECGHCRCEGEDGCSHDCEWCGQTGCEKCMSDTLDSWAHKGECAKALVAHEEGINARYEQRLAASAAKVGRTH